MLYVGKTGTSYKTLTINEVKDWCLILTNRSNEIDRERYINI